MSLSYRRHECATDLITASEAHVICLTSTCCIYTCALMGKHVILLVFTGDLPMYFSVKIYFFFLTWIQTGSENNVASVQIVILKFHVPLHFSANVEIMMHNKRHVCMWNALSLFSTLRPAYMTEAFITFWGYKESEDAVAARREILMLSASKVPHYSSPSSPFCSPSSPSSPSHCRLSWLCQHCASGSSIPMREKNLSLRYIKHLLLLLKGKIRVGLWREPYELSCLVTFAFVLFAPSWFSAVETSRSWNMFSLS